MECDLDVISSTWRPGTGLLTKDAPMQEYEYTNTRMSPRTMLEMKHGAWVMPSNCITLPSNLMHSYRPYQTQLCGTWCIYEASSVRTLTTDSVSSLSLVDILTSRTVYTTTSGLQVHQITRKSCHLHGCVVTRLLLFAKLQLFSTHRTKWYNLPSSDASMKWTWCIPGFKPIRNKAFVI